MSTHDAGVPAAHAVDLSSHLAAWAAGAPARGAVRDTLLALAAAAERIAALISFGPLAGALGAAVGKGFDAGDDQKALDVTTNQIVIEALAAAPVAYFASEEEASILSLNAGAPLAVAVDPLDGSSNIDVNVSVGTIFSLYAAAPAGGTASFFRPGREQLAAGFVIYGPQTALVLTVGQGVDLFILHPTERCFRLVTAGLSIPKASNEFAINASNYRHWGQPIRTFIDDCIEGAEGPREKNFNMRWVASLVAEAYRIFCRGGVYLYPGDTRPGYEQGRLRLIYEAAPIALLTEQAGGDASDGVERILDKVPATLHQRTPLVFGSAEKVARVARYHLNPAFARDDSPLFGKRSLFSA